MNNVKKRDNYISKDCLFMSMSHLIAMRSKDPNTQVGAVIVDKNDRILSMGYNGLPNGLDDDYFPWGREGEELETKYPYVVHAELNAILNYKGESLHGSTLYVSMFPCNECAKAIIQSGIKKVVYRENKYPDSNSTIAAERMFHSAGIILLRYEGDIVKMYLPGKIGCSNLALPKEYYNSGQQKNCDTSTSTIKAYDNL